MSVRRGREGLALAPAAAMVAAILPAGCDSPYQRQGILSDDVAHRLASMEPGDVSRLGEAGPLASSIVAPPTPEELAALQPGQRGAHMDRHPRRGGGDRRFNAVHPGTIACADAHSLANP